MKINLSELINQLGKTDVYLLDQIMKGRYQFGDKILDAGCGVGRNIDLLIRAGFTVEGIDLNEERIQHCKNTYPNIATNFRVGDLVTMPYESTSFDHIISSAVFHFAKSTDHFYQLFAEHIRVLRKGGTLFIRMTSLFGLDQKRLIALDKGRYYLSDDTERFLIAKPMIEALQKKHSLALIEAIKTVNVNEERAMAVLMFQKTL